jgi:hypothetical protein
MSTDRPSDLEPGLPEAEAAALAETGARLRHERPVPRAAFRSQLGAHLMADGRSRLGTRPRALWLRVAACATSGSALLLLVGIGAAGAGPFAS